MGGSITLDPIALSALVGCSFALGATLARPMARLARQTRETITLRNGKRPRNVLVEELRRTLAFMMPADPQTRRRAQPGLRDIMLRAEIDSLPAVERIWGKGARHSALDEVARVLGSGVRTRRRGTPAALDEVRIIPGEGFVIILRNPGEGAGPAVAQRLRSLLLRAPIDGLAGDIRLNASFGIAERAPGERYAAWRRRADSALAAAKARGEGEIIEAEVAQDMTLLPAPSDTIAPPAASAA